MFRVDLKFKISLKEDFFVEEKPMVDLLIGRWGIRFWMQILLVGVQSWFVGLILLMIHRILLRLIQRKIELILVWVQRIHLNVLERKSCWKHCQKKHQDFEQSWLESCIQRLPPWMILDEKSFEVRNVCKVKSSVSFHLTLNLGDGTFGFLLGLVLDEENFGLWGDCWWWLWEFAIVWNAFGFLAQNVDDGLFFVLRRKSLSWWSEVTERDLISLPVGKLRRCCLRMIDRPMEPWWRWSCSVSVGERWFPFLRRGHCLVLLGLHERRSAWWSVVVLVW